METLQPKPGPVQNDGPGAIRRRDQLTLLLIVLLGAGIRLYHLNAQSAWYDEAFSRGAFRSTGEGTAPRIHGRTWAIRHCITSYYTAGSGLRGLAPCKTRLDYRDLRRRLYPPVVPCRPTFLRYCNQPRRRIFAVRLADGGVFFSGGAPVRSSPISIVVSRARLPFVFIEPKSWEFDSLRHGRHGLALHSLLLCGHSSGFGFVLVDLPARLLPACLSPAGCDCCAAGCRLRSLDRRDAGER